MTRHEDDEALRFVGEVARRTKRDVPPEGYMAMGVNDYIALATRLMEATSVLGVNFDRSRRIIDVLAYLRDKHGAIGMEDAANILREGQVDSNVVDFWIEEGYLTEQVIDYVREGYPDKRNALQRAKDEADEDLRRMLEEL